uniref:Major facilitator superfamily (MFS) profile domain-containing protein n=1 Tax=Pseudo-nitzschia australis TaxID=44445 RepID=A0A7S4EPN7_9STRA|mmetsp:Transcript_9647/g.20910  ORF Transcript_9647/g.20910 Transcript_9647/m.20910 type:complete len:490 (+) Transcript_9647:383-1852(+)
MPKVDLASPEPNGESTADGTTEDVTKKKCCDLYDGNLDATGSSWLAVGRGMMIMSNIFISQSLLWLASNAAGCVVDGELQSCTTKIYGFVPSSLITNIAVISGLLSAFLMPILGALIDFTPYRRLIGIVVAIVLTVIQGAQVYTVESTWFAMSILQSIAVVFYQLEIVVIYAYLPDIAREVGQAKMNRFSTNFTSVQFIAEIAFLLIIAVIRIVFETSTVLTGQISQGVNTLTTIFFFGIGWFMYMTPRPAARELPEGRSLITEGFRQNWNTAKSIQKHYKRGLRWYFLAVTFAEASASAITSVSVVYLTDTLKLNTTDTIIFFAVTLFGALPGSQVAWWVTSKTNPNTSYKLSMVSLFFILMVGALVLDLVSKYYSFIWGFFVGAGLGWFYPVENLFFSMCLPKGQEAELAGFFMYCTQIMGWMPPLVFTLLIENNVAQKYGVIAAAVFFLVATGLLMFTCSWEEIVEEAKSGSEAAVGINNHLSGAV